MLKPNSIWIYLSYNDRTHLTCATRMRTVRLTVLQTSSSENKIYRHFDLYFRLRNSLFRKVRYLIIVDMYGCKSLFALKLMVVITFWNRITCITLCWKNLIYTVYYITTDEVITLLVWIFFCYTANPRESKRFIGICYFLNRFLNFFMTLKMKWWKSTAWPSG